MLFLTKNYSQSIYQFIQTFKNYLPNRKQFYDGLWQQNPAIKSLLGLCPLLAISHQTVNALGLGFATTLTLIGSNIMVSILRSWLIQEIRLAIFVLIIACMVTIVELLMQAWFHSLYNVLGIFIPLIVTNCVIIGRAESYASRQSPLLAAQDGLVMGLGFSLIVLILAMIRELLGSGQLFAHFEWLIGDYANSIKIKLFSEDKAILLAILPPGAFIGLGLLIALKNAIDE